MRKYEADIYDTEASHLINTLYSFLGPANVDKALKRHQRSLNLSGPLVREYTLKHIHPWWNAFMTFFKLKNKGKSIRRNLTPELKMLAGDAKKISILKRFMPKSVQNKYKRDLIDADRAIDYLFEIKIAWHYYLQGNDLQWYEDDGEKHPEFIVKTPNFDFNVECKRISVDISRKIKRRDFNRFAQELWLIIEKQNYTGDVDIVLNGRLYSNQIDALVSEVLELIKSGEIRGESAISLGQISLNLSKKCKKTVNVEQYEALRENLPNGQHMAYFSSQKSGNYIIDPIKISLKSKKVDNVLDGIYEKVYEAAKNQLDMSIPGIIVCFLEDVYELQELSSESGLQLMTCRVLNKEECSHIAGIGYSSEIQVHRCHESERYDNQGLFFRNPNCKFDEVETYEFTGSEASK
ncbi:MAG: hypothetical protein GY845_32020 [Planctomycetes bacterium]|nr:hypothetical protein [Planctomycetota bacterium]